MCIFFITAPSSVCFKWIRQTKKTKWKCVTLVSTQYGKEPVAAVQRWCKKKREFVMVSTPAVVQRYNSYMGCVDIVDQMLEYYRTFFKTKKWTLKTSLHFLDLAVVNSWFE